MKPAIAKARSLEAIEKIGVYVDQILKVANIEFVDSENGPIRNRPGLKDLYELELIQRKLEAIVGPLPEEPVADPEPVEAEAVAEIVEQPEDMPAPEPEAKSAKSRNKIK
jgi:hypothetical protein